MFKWLLCVIELGVHADARANKFGAEKACFSFEQPWASCLLKCGIFSSLTSVCLATQQDQGGDGQFLSFEQAERCEIVTF